MAQKLPNEKEIRDLEEQINFTKAQFDVISSSISAHKMLNLALKLSTLQKRIIDLERRLNRLFSDGDHYIKS